jgi:hypothetical protein
VSGCSGWKNAARKRVTSRIFVIRGVLQEMSDYIALEMHHRMKQRKATYSRAQDFGLET